jgi:hypothetical protein
MENNTNNSTKQWISQPHYTQPKEENKRQETKTANTRTANPTDSTQKEMGNLYVP